MLENLIAEIRECYMQAEDCERQARVQTDPALRKSFFDAAKSWLKLARSYELAERLQRFQPKPKR